MAGSYPDVPGVKVAYDVDGSAGFYELVSGAGSPSLRSLTAAEMTTLSSEAGIAVSRSGASVTSHLGIIFPKLQDIAGVNHGLNITGSGGGGDVRAFETSVDTTNGQDGTWVVRTSPLTLSANYRSGITAYSLTGIKAVRWNQTFGSQTGQVDYRQFHVYGSVPLTTTPNRLTLWHPTLDQELSGAALDFGDLQRGTTNDKTFRVKNLSSTLTANSILLSYSALTDATPTFVSQETLGLAGTFAATQTIASLAPGVISAVFTARLITTASASLSVYRQRLTGTAATWS